VLHNRGMAKPRSNSESPHDAPDIQPDELLTYLGGRKYPPAGRGDDARHEARRNAARALDEALRAIDGE